MRKLNFLFMSAPCLVAITAGLALAQPEGGPGGPGGGRMRMNPLTAALDTDEDGEISEKEIDNAVTALKALDKDKNGKLTRDEIRPNFGGPGGPGGPDGPGGGGFGGGGFGGGRGPNPDEMVARLMANDKNADGKLSKDELPNRVQGLLARADADKDGFATKDELMKMAEQEQGPGGGPGGPGEGPDGPDGPGGPGGGGPGGRGGFGGGRNPEAFVDRMFELDADKDGKLTREELSKMTDQFGRGFGGRGGGGREGRPDRPQRPL